METLDILASLDEAIRILRTVSNNHNLASGSNTIWRLVDHAQDHLDRQMRELLAPPAEPEHRASGADRAPSPATNNVVRDRNRSNIAPAAILSTTRGALTRIPA